MEGANQAALGEICPRYWVTGTQSFAVSVIGAMAVSDVPDVEYAMIDATIVPVHRHGHGAKGGLKISRLANPKADGQPKSSP